MIHGVNARLDEMQNKGVVINAHPSIGGHWSEQGHSVVATVVLSALGKHGMLGGEVLQAAH